MGKKITTNTIRILLLILLIAGVMGYGLYAQKHTAETETVEAVIAETMETMETPEIKVETPETEAETTETVEAENAASPSGDAVTAETRDLSSKVAEEKVWKNDIVSEDKDLTLRCRVFCYPDEYAGTRGFQVTYPEISGIENQEYQDLLNDTIQQMSLDRAVGDQMYYCRIEGSRKKEFQEVDINRAWLGEYDTYWYEIYGNLVSMDWRLGHQDWRDTIYDIETRKKVTLDDILVLDERFWDIFEKMTNQEKRMDSWVTYYYESFIDAYKNDEHAFESFINNKDMNSQFMWYIGADGELRIHGIEYPDIGIALSEFKEIIKPEYQWLLDDQVPGYYVHGWENQENQITNAENTTTGELTFYRAQASYGEYLDIGYFRVDGIENLKVQNTINDQILQKIMNPAIRDIEYTYDANVYYEENVSLTKEESVIHATSVVPSYYQNGRILSFTNIEKIERKAYTSPEGVKVEAAERDPYFLAFNFDCVTGEELHFSDVFDGIEICMILNDIDKDEDNDISQGNPFYIGDIKRILYDMMEQEGASENMQECHWFVDGDQNLCIYWRYSSDADGGAIKLPLTLFQDAIKPAYQSCFQFENADVTEEE